MNNFHNFPSKQGPGEDGSYGLGNWKFPDMTHLTSSVQAHLVQVYKCLAIALGCASFGAFLHGQHSFIQGGTVSFILGIACLIWLAMLEPRPDMIFKRMLLLSGFAFLEGLSLGPFLDSIVSLEPSLLILGLGGAALVFVCFSLSAIMSRRRSWLYIGGFLSSAASLLFWLSVGNMFFRSSTFELMEVYLGCIMMCFFILYDTQLIIERATRGNRDAIWNAAELFIDFVNLSIRLLVILASRHEKKERESEKKRSKQ